MTTSLTKSPDEPLANARDELFCQSYLVTFDAKKSYLETTPQGNPKTAAAIAYKMLQREDIKARCQQLAQKHIEKTGALADRLYAELEAIAFLDPMDFLTIDETNGEPILDLSAINKESLRCLDIEFGIGVTKDGDRIRTYKVKPHNKMDAIEKLLKLHQLYKGGDAEKQPLGIQVNVNFPIPASAWRNNQTAPEDIDAAEEV